MDLYSIEPDVSLNIVGVPCPLPPLKTLKALKGMETGQILEVITTNPIGKHSSPLFAKIRGNQALGSIKDKDGANRLYVRKA